MHNDKNDELTKLNETKPEPKRVPDETGGIYISGTVKIFDPETKEVFVSKREGG